MLSLFNGLRLAQQPTYLFRHMQDDQPVSSFRRSVTSSKRISGSGQPEEVFESRIEESDGCGLKRVIVERGLGSKVMKLTQVSDGSGGTTEERVFTNVSKEEEALFEDSQWPQAAAKLVKQTPDKALPASLAADTPNNVVDSSSTPQDSVPAPAEPEVDQCGVPIAGSFEATEGGSFHEAEIAGKSSPAAKETAGNDQQEGKQQQTQQTQQTLLQQQNSPSRRMCSRRRKALDLDPLSRQLLSTESTEPRVQDILSQGENWPCHFSARCKLNCELRLSEILKMTSKYSERGAAAPAKRLQRCQESRASCCLAHAG